ncbi:MAG: hypothetical protein H7Y19_08470, partial [Luteimonas sp.]|nr:hypothetical protein [Luteimonas sp.]
RQGYGGMLMAHVAGRARRLGLQRLVLAVNKNNSEDDRDRGGLHLDDGTPLDFALLERALLGLPSRLATQDLPGADRVPEAIALLEELTQRAELADFLTLPAYERLP